MNLQKIFFWFLILLGSAVSGGFSIRTARSLIDFWTLTENATARIERWEIKEKKDKFPITAFYRFESRGAVWQGSTELPEPWYLNEASAIAALREKSKEDWTVWFHPKNPEKSSLEKSFPMSLVIRTLICYGVCVYFAFFFRRFVRNNYS